MTDKPRFRVYIAISLDGYIADRAGRFDWLNAYFTPEIDFMGFAKTIGVTVWGRKTFDQAHRGEFAHSGRAVVMTRRPLPPGTPPEVEAFDGDVRELADRLREELAGTGKDIWLGGGGESLLPFHEAGLIDRWEIAIIPILLGDGIPLFPKRTSGSASKEGLKTAFESLRLVKMRTVSNGIAMLDYEPADRGASPVAPPVTSPTSAGTNRKDSSKRKAARKPTQAKRSTARAATAKSSTKASARQTPARAATKRPGRSR